MKTISIQSLMTAVTLAACLTAYGQDLTTEITVESEAEIALPAARPLRSVFPVAPAAEAPAVRLSPSQYSRAVDFSPLPGNAAMPAFTGLTVPDGRRGYLRLGYFPAYNLGAEAGYRIIDTEETSAGVAAGFHGSSYKSPAGYSYKHLFSSKNRTVSDNTFGAQAYASHAFSPMLRLRGDIAYFHAALKSPSMWDSEQKQGIDALDLSLGLSGAGQFDYDLSFAYSRFGLTDNIFYSSGLPGQNETGTTGEYAPATDDRFRADLKAGVTFGADSTQRFGIDVAFDLLHRHGAQPDAFNFGPVTHSSSGIVTFLPAYSANVGKVDLRVGVRIDLGVNSPDKSFHITPDVMATWSPRPAFTVFGIMKGGEQFRTLRDRYSYSAFAPGLTASSRSFTPVDGRVGITVRPVGAASISLWGGYASVRRMPMGALFNDMLIYVPVGLHGWTAGLDASYILNDKLTIGAEARLYPHSYSGGSAYAPDRAHCTLAVKASVRPIKPLLIDLGYSLRTGRRYYSYTLVSNSDGNFADRQANAMGNISDLSLGGTYDIASNFSVFLSLENLLCRRVMILPTVFTQRIHGLAGISLRF